MIKVTIHESNNKSSNSLKFYFKKKGKNQFLFFFTNVDRYKKDEVIFRLKQYNIFDDKIFKLIISREKGNIILGASLLNTLFLEKYNYKEPNFKLSGIVIKNKDYI